MAESLASTGTAVEVVPQGLFPSGLSNSTHVVGEVREGVVEGIARCRARGEREWLWDVEIGPSGGAPAAVATVAIAVRNGSRLKFHKTGSGDPCPKPRGPSVPRAKLLCRPDAQSSTGRSATWTIARC